MVDRTVDGLSRGTLFSLDGSNCPTDEGWCDGVQDDHGRVVRCWPPSRLGLSGGAVAQAAPLPAGSEVSPGLWVVDVDEKVAQSAGYSVRRLPGDASSWCRTAPSRDSRPSR